MNAELKEEIVHIIFDDKCITRIQCYEEGVFMDLEECMQIAIENGFKKKNGIIIVIAESYLCGRIFRYGNHGEEWEKVGKTMGIA